MLDKSNIVSWFLLYGLSNAGNASDLSPAFPVFLQMVFLG
jgi:hypothetical protein